VVALGLIAALPREARSLGVETPLPMRVLSLPGLGELVVSGMGAERACRAAKLLAERGARRLISWGLAGALQPGLLSGQMLCPAGVVDSTGRRYPVTADLQALCLERVCPEAVTGDLISWDEVLFDPNRKLALYRERGVAAIDMESAAIAQVAREWNLEFLVLRSVFDPAGQVLPASVLNNTDAWGGVRLAGLAAALLRRPSDLLLLPGLVRLARRSGQSLKAMANALPALTQDDHPERKRTVL